MWLTPSARRRPASEHRLGLVCVCRKQQREGRERAPTPVMGVTPHGASHRSSCLISAPKVAVIITVTDKETEAWRGAARFQVQSVQATAGTLSVTPGDSHVITVTMIRAAATVWCIATTCQHRAPVFALCRRVTTHQLHESREPASFTLYLLCLRQRLACSCTVIAGRMNEGGGPTLTCQHTSSSPAQCLPVCGSLIDAESVILHFTDEDTGPGRGCDLPKVTQAGSGHDKPGSYNDKKRELLI